MDVHKSFFFSYLDVCYCCAKWHIKMCGFLNDLICVCAKYCCLLSLMTTKMNEQNLPELTIMYFAFMILQTREQTVTNGYAHVSINEDL